MRPPATESPLVELRGVTKAYQEGDTERVVLRGVDATIRRGELCVLIGRSGSGKSTLLNLIGGIDVPTAGEIVVDGLPLARATEARRTLFRRHHVGFVFQFFNLIPTLTVEENLRLPLELKGWPTAGRRFPNSSRGASSNGWRWRERWSTSPCSCSPTSRRGTSIWTRAGRCSICSTASPGGQAARW